MADTQPIRRSGHCGPPLGRLDQALVGRGLCESRTRAQRLILAGRVLVNGARAEKAGLQVRPEDAVEVSAPERYVSRGGYKLERAFEAFGLDIRGGTALDLGASTGGFTDCLLQHGARRVYAVDVGAGLLAWKLRQDPRVVVMERVNARYLAPGDFPAPFAGVDLVTIDCAFISLRLLLPPAMVLTRAGGRLVALIKPQFEVGKRDADRAAGVIRDPALHRRVVEEMEAFVGGLPALRWVGVVASPVQGGAGNREFLACLEKTG